MLPLTPFQIALLCLLTTVLPLVALSTDLGAEQRADTLDVWIGTSRTAPSRGIYHCVLDPRTGRLSTPEVAAEVEGPGFLAMHPLGSHLYAVCAVEGEPSVAAYAIEDDGRRRSLSFVNSLPIGDGGAAHLAVDRTGTTLLTAQYGGGSVAVFSLNRDGSLHMRTQIVEHDGGSQTVPDRQEGPHPHWVGCSPDNRFLFVPDLGMDKVVIYRLDAENSRIEPSGLGQLPPGSGPRHMKFHTSGKWVYVLNELALTVTVFDYDAEVGAMTAKQSVATVPPHEAAKEKARSASEIRVHPTGRFVYSANRGHDTITVFEVNQETGTLTAVEREPVRGATPRNFNLDPSGRWLLAAGQHSHTLASFEVNAATGELTYNQSIVHAPSAICVLFGHE